MRSTHPHNNNLTKIKDSNKFALFLKKKLKLINVQVPFKLTEQMEKGFTISFYSLNKIEMLNKILRSNLKNKL